LKKQLRSVCPVGGHEILEEFKHEHLYPITIHPFAICTYSQEGRNIAAEA